MSLLAALLLAGALAACSPGEPPSWDGSRSLLALRTAFDPPTEVRPAHRLPPADPGCTPVLQMLDSFRRTLATRLPPDDVLETMSTCLKGSGRQLELIGLLHDATAAHPQDLGLQLRLAGAFVELGDVDEALRRVEAVRKLVPDEPEALFLEGLILGRRPGEPDERLLRRARDAWARLLQVAPAHRGMGRFPPELVRRDLQALEQELALLHRELEHEQEHRPERADDQQQARP